MKQSTGLGLVSLLALIEAAWTGLSLLSHGHLVISSRLLPLRGETQSLLGVLMVLLLASAALAIRGHLPWARIVVMTLAAIYLVGGAVGIWCGASGYTQLGAIFFYCDQAVVVLINGWILWYLSLPSIRLAFHGPKADWSKF